MSKKALNILYVGALWEGSTCLQRMRALEEIGYSVRPVNTQPDYVRDKEHKLINRILGKLFGPADLADANVSIAQNLQNLGCQGFSRNT